MKTAAGTIGSRGTEFQTIIDEEDNAQVLLIGPGEDNTLGLRPGAVEVANELGSVLLDTPFSFTQLSLNQIPTPPVEITQEQLQQFQNFLDVKANLDVQDVESAIKEGLFDNNLQEFLVKYRERAEKGIQAKKDKKNAEKLKLAS